MSTTPMRLTTTEKISLISSRQKNQYLLPASASFSVNFSCSRKDPTAAEHNGVRNVKTIASERDRYCNENQRPKMPKNLQRRKVWAGRLKITWILTP